LAYVATGITTGQRSEKINNEFENLEKGVATIVFMENYGKTKKNEDKTSLWKLSLDPGVGYVWGRC